MSYIFQKPAVLCIAYPSENRVVCNSKACFLVLLQNQTICNPILELSQTRNLYLQIFLLVSILHLEIFDC